MSTQNSKILLSILIVNYNTPKLTERAIDSALTNIDISCSVYVVDNASTDDSRHILEDRYARNPQVHILSQDKNLGFAGGNNKALAQISTPFIFLLNSDAYFLPDTKLSTLIERMRSQQDIAVSTPDVLLASGQRDPACHRGLATPWNAACYFLGLEKIGFFPTLFAGYHLLQKDFQSAHEIDACSGAAMLVRKTAMDQIGLFDERFFMYGEDLDWCFRFQQGGWKIFFDPAVTVIHEKHSSGIKKKDTVTRFAFYDAMRLYYKKHDLGLPFFENVVLFCIWVLSKIR